MKLSLKIKFLGAILALGAALAFGQPPASANLVVKATDTPAASTLSSWYDQSIPACFHSPIEITFYAYNDDDMDNYLKSVGLSDGTSYSTSGAGEIEGLYDNHHTKISVRVNDKGGFDSEVLTHEYGHFVWFRVMSKADRDEYRNIYNSQRKHHSLVSDYARVNLEEGFAEAFAFYLTAPDTLRQKDDASYQFLSNWQSCHMMK